MQHRIVSREAWTAARKAHLEREKAFTRLRDELSAERRDLPWVKVGKTYVFDTPDGGQTLSELFDGRSQLIVYHFMFAPEDREGCRGCSLLSDHVDSANQHLAHHDVTFVAVSRAPLARLAAYRQRMGWHFRWVSSLGSDFNADYHVSFTPEDLAKGPTSYNYEIRKNQTADEAPGLSVFCTDDSGAVFHTYSSYGRGGDLLIGAYNYLDLTPKGRNEARPMDWVRRHDRYGI